jgi:hypothetical protein
VQRDQLPPLRSGEGAAAVAPAHPARRGLAEPQSSFVPEQRLCEDVRRLALDREHERGRRPALVEDVKRLVDDPTAQQPEPRIEREQVEAVMPAATIEGILSPALPSRPRKRSRTWRASVAGGTCARRSLPTQ